MIYQIAAIAVLILLALAIAKRLNSKNHNINDDLIYEDDMEKDELDSIDEEIN
tara:strand:+ start:814 stop:972 length:159 start_codon:yes stop_codon:yes gene_type:complete